MKKLLFLPFLFLSINIQISAQFVQQNSGTNAILSTIDFVDSSDGWAIPWLADYLLKTTDGGIHWLKVNYPYSFNNIKFINNKIGYAINYRITGAGGLYKTTDGGNSWFLISDTLDVDYNQRLIFILDSNNVWFGISNKLYKTIDEGQTFTTHSFSETPQQYVGEEINDIFFLNKDVGWVIYFYDIYSTIDGGETWTKIESPKCRNIFFINKDVGFALAGNSLIKTENGGKTWVTMSSISDNAEKINFINDTVGFYLDWHVKRTVDSGLNWKKLSYAEMVPIGIRDYTALSENSIWISGENGFIAKYDTTDTTRSITVITPNGGENWQGNSCQVITWKKHNVELLNLSYSTDSGQSWINIADSVDAGYIPYYWCPVPKTPSESCLIRASDSNHPEVFDISDKVFTIYYDFTPRITITSPNEGAWIYRNNKFEITWSSQNVNYVNILLSLDNGLSWENIVSNIENLWSYSWLVPDTTSEKCLIRIENSTDTSFFDVSDQSFRITEVPRFSYFPLSTGNKWFFSQGYDEVIKLMFEVEKDTILNDGYSYAKLNMYSVSAGTNLNLLVEGYNYLRNEDYKIIEYPNIITLDFNMNVGDTLVISSIDQVYSVLDAIVIENVIGRYLPTYVFFTTPFDYHSYTDSIGFNTLWATTWHNWIPEYLLGCEIDGRVYGKTITSINDNWEIVTDFILHQNYPNPFNPTTKIEYSIPKISFVTLKIYDILGREVATLVNEEKQAGNYIIEFDGKELTSGIYFYKLQAGNYSVVKKMVLMR